MTNYSLRRGNSYDQYDRRQQKIVSRDNMSDNHETDTNT